MDKYGKGDGFGVHVPVLPEETMDVLKPEIGNFFIDATLGAGGHTKEILKRMEKEARMAVIDWDKEAVERFKKSISSEDEERVIMRVGNYADLTEMALKEGWPKVDGLLVDLGFSSDQIENSGRGFSFSRDEPLLMTYSEELKPLRDLLAEISESDLADIIYHYGGERYSRRIAKAIKEGVKKGEMRSSGELAGVCRKVLPKSYERGRIDPATRTFQALRIYVNRELENLEKLLTDLPLIMNSGGKAVIISFHSLEDRMVKNRFRELAREGNGELINKKPIKASREEEFKNRRSRSAKLRGFIFK